MDIIINEKTLSIFDININKGVQSGIISIDEDEFKITYFGFRNYTTSFKNPEEKIRASYFTELVLDYKYPKSRIDFEVLPRIEFDGHRFMIV